MTVRVSCTASPNPPTSRFAAVTGTPTTAMSRARPSRSAAAVIAVNAGIRRVVPLAVDGVLPEGFPREKTTREWNCRNKGGPQADCTKQTPCVSCRGRRSQASGRRKQRDARKALEVVTGAPASRFYGQLSNEESWNGLPLRVEVKSGAQCGPIWTRYAAAEIQAEANNAIGNTKPFVLVAMGQRTTDGLVVCRLSQLSRVVEALVNQ